MGCTRFHLRRWPLRGAAVVGLGRVEGRDGAEEDVTTSTKRRAPRAGAGGFVDRKVHEDGGARGVEAQRREPDPAARVAGGIGTAAGDGAMDRLRDRVSGLSYSSTY